MAKVYDEIITDDSANDKVIALLDSWDSWSHTDERYFNIGGEDAKFKVYYLDTAESVGIGVGIWYETEQGSARSLYALLLTNNTYQSDDIYVIRYVATRLYAVENNTSLYICAMSVSDDPEPVTEDKIHNGFFVAEAVSQDGQHNIQSILGRFYGDGTQSGSIDPVTKNITDTGYIIYVPGDPAVKKTKAFDISYEQEYNCLLPLIGADVGIPAGIFYPLMTEGDAKEVGPMPMNGKTFYLCGNAAVIDYYEE